MYSTENFTRQRVNKRIFAKPRYMSVCLHIEYLRLLVMMIMPWDRGRHSYECDNGLYLNSHKPVTNEVADAPLGSLRNKVLSQASDWRKFVNRLVWANMNHWQNGHITTYCNSHRVVFRLKLHKRLSWHRSVMKLWARLQ